MSILLDDKYQTLVIRGKIKKDETILSDVINHDLIYIATLKHFIIKTGNDSSKEGFKLSFCVHKDIENSQYGNFVNIPVNEDILESGWKETEELLSIMNNHRSEHNAFRFNDVRITDQGIEEVKLFLEKNILIESIKELQVTKRKLNEYDWLI